jgi:hypothetical protein
MDSFCDFVCGLARFLIFILFPDLLWNPVPQICLVFQISGESDRLHGHSGGDFGPGCCIQSGLRYSLFLELKYLYVVSGVAIRIRDPVPF